MREHRVARKVVQHARLQRLDKHRGVRPAPVAETLREITLPAKRRRERDAPQQPPRLRRVARGDLDLKHAVLRHLLLPCHDEKHRVIVHYALPRCQHVRREEVNDLVVVALLAGALVGVLKVRREEKDLGPGDRRARRLHAKRRLAAVAHFLADAHKLQRLPRGRGVVGLHVAQEHDEHVVAVHPLVRPRAVLLHEQRLKVRAALEPLDHADRHGHRAVVQPDDLDVRVLDALALRVKQQQVELALLLAHLGVPAALKRRDRLRREREPRGRRARRDLGARGAGPGADARKLGELLRQRGERGERAVRVHERLVRRVEQHGAVDREAVLAHARVDAAARAGLRQHVRAVVRLQRPRERVDACLRVLLAPRAAQAVVEVREHEHRRGDVDGRKLGLDGRAARVEHEARGGAPGRGGELREAVAEHGLRDEHGRAQPPVLHALVHEVAQQARGRGGAAVVPQRDAAVDEREEHVVPQKVQRVHDGELRGREQVERREHARVRPVRERGVEPDVQPDVAERLEDKEVDRGVVVGKLRDRAAQRERELVGGAVLKHAVLQRAALVHAAELLHLLLDDAKEVERVLVDDDLGGLDRDEGPLGEQRHDGRHDALHLARRRRQERLALHRERLRVDKIQPRRDAVGGRVALRVVRAQPELKLDKAREPVAHRDDDVEVVERGHAADEEVERGAAVAPGDARRARDRRGQVLGREERVAAGELDLAREVGRAAARARAVVHDAARLGVAAPALEARARHKQARAPKHVGVVELERGHLGGAAAREVLFAEARKVRVHRVHHARARLRGEVALGERVLREEREQDLVGAQRGGALPLARRGRRGQPRDRRAQRVLPEQRRREPEERRRVRARALHEVARRHEHGVAGKRKRLALDPVEAVVDERGRRLRARRGRRVVDLHRLRGRLHVAHDALRVLAVLLHERRRLAGEARHGRGRHCRTGRGRVLARAARVRLPDAAIECVLAVQRERRGARVPVAHADAERVARAVAEAVDARGAVAVHDARAEVPALLVD